jgi:hypothetical protein
VVNKQQACPLSIATARQQPSKKKPAGGGGWDEWIWIAAFTRMGPQPLDVCKCSSRRDAVSFCGVSVADDEGMQTPPKRACIAALSGNATETPESMPSIYG